tara:strand:+ start:1230 stop:2198 length:969 start_codon:yes stop_codon:yes gene_type:complete
MKKILVIRLSSIGDIILTSPLTRCLKLQQSSTIHFLVKQEYKDLLHHNPYIDKIITFSDSYFKTSSKLKTEEYDLVIDLQNNLLSNCFKFQLNKKTLTFKKRSLKRLLFIYFNINLQKNHIVDRYFDVIKSIKVFNDQNGLEYFLEKNTHIKFSFPDKYIAWSIGASHNNKKLSFEQILEVCNDLCLPIVLLGGKNETNMGEEIKRRSSNQSIYNFAGKLSIDKSAYFLKHSLLVLTNDTGLMHIASAFKKTILSFWGCTKPMQGFRPYLTDVKSREIVFNPTSAPCSKYGKRCRLYAGGCVKRIEPRLITNSVQQILLELG